MKRNGLATGCYYICLSVCLHCYYHKKPYRMCLLFRACFVTQLADFKPGCCAFQRRFHMYVLTHVVFKVDLGRELVYIHVTRLGGEKRERQMLQLLSDRDM
jgi:hypothetical protein